MNMAKKKGMGHVEITLILVFVISLIGMVVAFSGKHQDDTTKTEITNRF